ncbi:PREDICTED: protein FAM166A [Ficedula albicollis]|nr:PREDICTED: protein FAM166A [Ficedula albicollis]
MEKLVLKLTYRSCNIIMAGPKENSIFPRNPYYIPGYGGYVPQFSFKFGDTYGRITHDLLTDPNVRKSPRSLLAPLDNMENLQEFRYHIEHPGYVTYQPITSPPEVPLGPQPVPGPVLEEPMMAHTDPRLWQSPPGPAPGALLTWPPQGLVCPSGYVTYQPITSPPEVPLGPQPVPGPVLEEPMMAHTDPRLWQSPPGPAPGALLTWPPQGLALHPAAQDMEREVAKPPLASVLGKGSRTCQCNCGGSKTQRETGGVVLPGGAATADYTLPVLPVPNAIRQKVIPGYAGFVPHLFDKVGMTYIPAVKKAMNEFDRYQLLQRNPPYTLGTRFPLTHWPDTKIYSRAGLKPAYAGFVPCLQDLCGLTYGNATRESYRCEQRRRGIAL